MPHVFKGQRDKPAMSKFIAHTNPKTHIYAHMSVHTSHPYDHCTVNIVDTGSA